MLAYSKVLLVEGEDDKRVIPQLVEANGIKWGENKKEWIVEIQALGSVEKLLDKEELSIQVRMRRKTLKILGIILDADDYPANRWQSIRNCLIEIYPDIPEELPPTGLIHPGEIKVGVWMMPDNKERGMLETFLQFLLPENGKALWDFSEQSCQQAKAQGACFKDCHSDKAKIHTWLAWQNPPGRQLHQAVTERILSSDSPQAAVFMQWFKELFEV
ncbi:DUF3226 domain-containing protein [Candidatus Electronema sp. JM]|uniref:DUF3226 domain-containing protein n=1 Tax=Candidatus Electronema sp. JM TaxID=3401571 RepID=UPI003AA9948A